MEDIIFIEWIECATISCCIASSVDTNNMCQTPDTLIVHKQFSPKIPLFARFFWGLRHNSRQTWDILVREYSRKLAIFDIRELGPSFRRSQSCLTQNHSNLFCLHEYPNANLAGAFDKAQSFYKKISFITSTHMLHVRVEVSVIIF